MGNAPDGLGREASMPALSRYDVTEIELLKLPATSHFRLGRYPGALVYGLSVERRQATGIGTRMG